MSISGSNIIGGYDDAMSTSQVAVRHWDLRGSHRAFRLSPIETLESGKGSTSRFDSRTQKIEQKKQNFWPEILPDRLLVCLTSCRTTDYVRALDGL
jgi:hypothetical protein